MRKPKPLPYKKGDEIIFLNLSGYGAHISEGVVTVVRQDQGVVYVHYSTMHGSIFPTSFGRVPGNFQENPRPLWMLRHKNGDNFKKLSRRLEKANKLYEEHRRKCDDIQRDVDYEANKWKSEEAARRKELVPHGYAYLMRVAARMGFHKPPEKKIA